MAFESIYLYNHTLQHPQLSVVSVVGQFMGRKAQEIVVCRGSCIELYKLESSGTLKRIALQDTFSILRHATPFKMPGTHKDYLAVTSDSGNFTVLEFSIATNKFVSVFNEPFAKSGITRLTPGQFLAADPKGRAVMCAALEKNKLVYVLNRDAEKLTISSPLEAHRANIITYAACAIDVGYENPNFACIEADTEAKRLVIYELDLGLNHVVIKKSIQIPSSSNFLMASPLSNGVFVCSKDFVSYHTLVGDKNALYVPIPKRSSQANGNYSQNCIIAGAVHKLKNDNLVLLQTNFGDLFRLKLKLSDDEEPYPIQMDISYFDTLPLCDSMNVLKAGFLFVDSERGNKVLYEFEDLDQEGLNVLASSIDFVKPSEEVDDVVFEPKLDALTHLSESDEFQSRQPLTGAHVVKSMSAFNANEFYLGSGNSSGGRLQKLVKGITCEELVNSELPEKPTGVFTVPSSSSESTHKYLLISFAASSTVLEVDESVDQLENSGFDTDVRTLGLYQMGTKSFVQVHSEGILQLESESNSEGESSNEAESQNRLQNVLQWYPPAGISIDACSGTSFQLIVALSNRELVYFELDDKDRIKEHSDRCQVPDSVCSISLGSVPQGKLRSEFVAVACKDSSLRLFSTAPGAVFDELSAQELSNNASSILLESKGKSVFLHVGLVNGLYLRAQVDSRGNISDRVVKYLGPKQVGLYPLPDSVLVCSSRPLIASVTSTGFQLEPLIYESNFEHGAAFVTADIQGLVAVFDENLAILSLDSNDGFSGNSWALQAQPKQISVHEKFLYISQCDRNKNMSNDRVLNENASQVDVFDMDKGEIIDKIVFGADEQVFRAVKILFGTKKEAYLVVSTAQNSQFFLKVYDQNSKFVHSTRTEKPVATLVPFCGLLVAGIGNVLRMYDMGQKQLLRKSELVMENFQNIVAVETQGLRLAVGDVRNSVSFVVYKPKRNILIQFADDIVQRHVTSLKFIDYDSVIGGDKFGNIWILRCPKTASEASDEDDVGLFLSISDSSLNGAPFRLELLAHFYINDIPTSFHKIADPQGLNECIVYTGLLGTLGVLIPLITNNEIGFLQKLQKEISMRLSLTGRNSLKYRSYYTPLKSVIDGELCEQFWHMTNDTKSEIALKLSKSTREIERKLVGIKMRNSV